MYACTQQNHTLFAHFLPTYRFTAASNNHGVVSLLLRRRYRINTPNRPCVEDTKYSVLKCTEEFVAKTVGCSSPWIHVEVLPHGKASTTL